MRYCFFFLLLIVISGCLFYKNNRNFSVVKEKRYSSLLIDLSGVSKEEIKKFVIDYSHLPIYVSISPSISTEDLKDIFLMKGKIKIVFLDFTDYRYPIKAGFKDDILSRLYKFKYIYKKVTDKNLNVLFLPNFINNHELKNILSQMGIKYVFLKDLSPPDIKAGTGKSVSYPLYFFSFSTFSYEKISRYIYLKATDKDFKDKFSFVIENSDIDYIKPPEVNFTENEEEIKFSEVEKEYFDIFKKVREDVEKFKNSGNIKMDIFSKIMDEVYFLEEKKSFDYKTKAKVFYSMSRIYKMMNRKIPTEIFDYYSKNIGFEFSEVNIKIDGRKENEWNKANYFSLKEGLNFWWGEDNSNFYFLFNSNVSDFKIYFNVPSSDYYSFKDSTGNVMSRAFSHYLDKKGDKFLFYRANSDDTYSLIGGLYDVKVSTSFLEFSIPQYFFRTRKGGDLKFNLCYENKFYPAGSSFFLKLNDEKGLILRFFDPLGDSLGPGWYKIPLSTAYSKTTVDIREFCVKKNSNFIMFKLKMSKLTEIKNVFLDIYIDLNGSFRKGNLSLLLERDAYTDDYSCWEIAISFFSGKGIIYKYEFDKIKEIGEVDYSILNNRLTFKVSRDILYGENPEKWGFIVATGFTDEKGNVLEVKREVDINNPGGGRPEYGSPNIFDITEESSLSQKRILSRYLKKAGVRLKTIRR